MSDGKAKAAGGAVVGAGGILALILKSGSAEMHAVEGVTQAGRLARAGEGTVLVGAKGASLGARGLGVASHAGGELSAMEKFAVVAAADAKLTPWKPLAAAAIIDDGAHVGTLARAGEKTGTSTGTALGTGAKAATKAGTKVGKATATERVKALLAHMEHEGVDPKDLLDQLQNVYDLSQKLDPDVDDDVDKRFAASSLDFHGDIIPSVEGVAVDGLDGATRSLLTDGHTLIPSMKLPSMLLSRDSHEMTRDEKSEAAAATIHPESNFAIYVETPLPPSVTFATEGPSANALGMTVELMTAKDLVWTEVTMKDLKIFPRVLEDGDRRFAAFSGLPRKTADLVPRHLVIVRVVTNETR